MSEVTRSMEATTAAQTARVARARRSPPSGWWGVALLACTEAALFGTILASYWYLRFRAVSWPPDGIDPPAVAGPLALNGALLATGVPMLLAARAARVGRPRATWWLIAAAVVVQAGYLAGQILLFKSDLGKFSPRADAYGSIYFTMLATHHAHVLVGVLLNLALLARLLRGLTNYRATGVRVVALYWYFVDAMAVLVVLTQLSPSL